MTWSALDRAYRLDSGRLVAAVGCKIQGPDALGGSFVWSVVARPDGEYTPAERREIALFVVEAWAQWGQGELSDEPPKTGEILTLTRGGLN